MENTFYSWLVGLNFSSGVDAAIKVVSAFYVVSSLLPLSNSGYWWVRGFDFPRLQLAALGVACIAGVILFWNGRWEDYMFTVALVIGIGFDAYRIWPYLPVATKESNTLPPNSNAGQSITLISANVLQSNRQSKKLLDLIQKEQPDAVTLLETDQ